jgi:hypothetical protein
MNELAELRPVLLVQTGDVVSVDVGEIVLITAIAAIFSTRRAAMLI